LVEKREDRQELNGKKMHGKEEETSPPSGEGEKVNGGEEGVGGAKRKEGESEEKKDERDRVEMEKQEDIGLPVKGDRREKKKLEKGWPYRG